MEACMNSRTGATVRGIAGDKRNGTKYRIGTTGMTLGSRGDQVLPILLKDNTVDSFLNDLRTVPVFSTGMRDNQSGTGEYRI